MQEQETKVIPQDNQIIKHCNTCDKNEHNTPNLKLTPTHWGMLCSVCLRSWQDYQSRNQRSDDED